MLHGHEDKICSLDGDETRIFAGFHDGCVVEWNFEHTPPRGNFESPVQYALRSKGDNNLSIALWIGRYTWSRVMCVGAAVALSALIFVWRRK